MKPRVKLTLSIFALLLCIGGYALLIIHTNWIVALALFLVMWSSNINESLKNDGLERREKTSTISGAELSKIMKSKS
jgi:hypothetical protein